VVFIEKVVIIPLESKRRKPKVHDPLQNVFDNMNRTKDRSRPFISFCANIKRRAGDDAIKHKQPFEVVHCTSTGCIAFT
jgi:hypothetical protein